MLVQLACEVLAAGTRESKDKEGKPKIYRDLDVYVEGGKNPGVLRVSVETDSEVSSLAAQLRKKGTLICEFIKGQTAGREWHRFRFVSFALLTGPAKA